MSVFNSALDDYKFFLSRGAEPVGAAWKVAAMYRDIMDEVDLAKRLLATNGESA